MPIWKIESNTPVKVSETKFKQEKLLEQHLEDWVVSDPALLGEPLLVVGRQVIVPEVKDRLDVLALDPQGNAVVIELKRGKIKDPVDMQALRYASYISKWQFGDFENLAKNYLGKHGDSSFNFNQLYEQFCGNAGVEETPDLNADQRIIIVGAEVKERLGSVALWLRDHNIDIKVIEVELFREDNKLFIEPHIIIPLPVSRFAATGKASTEGPKQLWLSDGKTWHLEKRCSPKTKEMFLQIDDLVRDNFEVDGPRWGQKSYVAYRIGNYNWLTVKTSSVTLRLILLVKTGTFTADSLAESLGVQVFDQDESMAEKLALPSSVMISNHSESTDKVWLRVKEEFDFSKDEFLQFMKQAYEAFAKQ